MKSPWRCASVVMALGVAGACGGASGVQGTAEVHAPIVNGQGSARAVSLSARQALAIGAVLTDDGTGDWYNFCTGTLVAPDVVLTAAHCVLDDRGRTSPVSQLAFVLGDDSAAPVASARVRAVHVHPGYAETDDTAEYDVAILQLQRALTQAEPLAVNCGALASSSFVGRTLQMVGYGDTATRGSNNTRKWWASEAVVSLGSYDFTVDGGGNTGVCTGDSGSPALWSMSGQVRIVGVLSWGDLACGNQDHFGRTDHTCSFVTPFLPATPTPAPGPVDTGNACVIEGVTFSGATLQQALHFMETMTCTECDAVLDSRTCEDAINNPDQCTIGSTCTGCSDDDTRTDGVSCAELSGYAYFGTAGAQALYDHVTSGGGTGSTPVVGPDVTVEGVVFSAAQAAATLQLVNSATLAALDDDVPLDARAAQGIVSGRPFTSLEQVAAVPYVGPTALSDLRAFPH